MRITAILATALLLAGCGDGAVENPVGNPPAAGGSGGGSSLPQSAAVAMVSGDDGYGSDTHAFQPTEARIGRGGSVTWNNGSGVIHNVTFSGSGAPANIPNHASGSHTRSFPEAGSFSFSCTNHPGMTGVVAVE
jgi:plastocyanin